MLPDPAGIEPPPNHQSKWATEASFVYGLFFSKLRFNIPVRHIELRCCLQICGTFKHSINALGCLTVLCVLVSGGPTDLLDTLKYINGEDGDHCGRARCSGSLLFPYNNHVLILKPNQSRCDKQQGILFHIALDKTYLQIWHFFSSKVLIFFLFLLVRTH